MEKTKELVIPSYIYYKDPIQAVKSLLGNDVEIISTKVNHIILHNGYISVCVNYKALDFNSFKLYKVLETKLLTVNTNTYVATKIQDTITNEIITTPVKLGVKGNSFKYIYIIYINTLNQISYGGVNIKSKHDIFHSYSSLFDSKYLSYHGTTIPKLVKDNEPLNKLFEYKSKNILENDIKSLNNLLTKNNNYSKTVYTLSSSDLKGIKYKSLEELIKEFETISKVSGLIDLSNYSLNDLIKLLLNKKGNIILSNQRDNPFMCYISLDNNYHLLTENVLNNLITVVSYDAFNYKKFEE
ncbi:MAG: hypothetical protein MR765_02380 [Tenericutes bacterium]|nr:hypothetical protein [Mycoplasmatota bacterium]